LLLRFEGPLTDDSIAEFYRVIRQYWTAADASMGIVDFSSVTEFALSSDLVGRLAQQEPCMPDAARRPPRYRCSEDACVWSSAHVPDYGRAFKAALDCSTYHGRGISSTRHSVSTLRTLGVTPVKVSCRNQR